MESIKKSLRNHETWLANYTGHSLKQYKNAWHYWIEYLGSKGEKWVLENKETEDWGKHLVNFHRWLTKQPKRRGRGTLSDNSAKTFTNSLRGYLKHIGVVAGLTRVQKSEIATVESNPILDYPFNLEVKAQLLKVSSPLEEYIVCAGVSFGFRIGDFKRLTQNMLVPLLDAEPPIQLPRLQTQKEGVPAYPFIDRDAKDAILRLLAEYYPNKTLAEIDAILKDNKQKRMIDLTDREINKTLKDLFKKAGVSTGDFRIRFHILRKFLTDNLANVCSGDKWKHFVGKLTKSPYVQPEGKEAYKKVLAFTNVNGRKVKASNQELEELKKTIQQLEGENSASKTRITLLQKRFEGGAELVEKLQHQFKVLNDAFFLLQKGLEQKKAET